MPLGGHDAPQLAFGEDGPDAVSGLARICLTCRPNLKTQKKGESGLNTGLIE